MKSARADRASSTKADAIRAAIAEGYSLSQILAADRSLNCHDIFHAVSEIPTSHWRRVGNAGHPGKTTGGDSQSKPPQHRRD